YQHSVDHNVRLQSRREETKMDNWFYEQGIYLGTVLDWGLRTVGKKRSPYFFLTVRMTHKEDEAGGLVPLPPPFVAMSQLWLTEKGRPGTLSALHRLGFEGEDLERLHPGAADAHDFTGQEILFRNSHEVHPQYGPDETWWVVRAWRSHPNVLAKME